MSRRSKTRSPKARCPLTRDRTLRQVADERTAFIQDNFPRGVAKPALRALLAAGYAQLEQLTGISEPEILALHGMGPKAVQLLRAGLKALGLDFRQDQA